MLEALGSSSPSAELVALWAKWASKINFALLLFRYFSSMIDADQYAQYKFMAESTAKVGTI
jgi:hypothetical protein